MPINSFLVTYGDHPSGRGFAGYFGVPGDQTARPVRSHNSLEPTRFATPDQAQLNAMRVLLKYLNNAQTTQQFLKARDRMARPKKEEVASPPPTPTPEENPHRKEAEKVFRRINRPWNGGALTGKPKKVYSKEEALRVADAVFSNLKSGDPV